MTEIKASYLVWIGSEHYKTMDEYASEVVTHGVSKRLPGMAIGSKLMEPGSVIFVAHDEGEYHECAACVGEVSCPDCRIIQRDIENVRAESAELLKRYDGDRKAFALGASGSDIRSLRVRDARIVKFEEKQEACETCYGSGSFTGGTGGNVALADGTAMDYRCYNYHLHQPNLFDAATVASKAMCEECGGTGKLPDGRIFGLIVPTAVEYIVAGTETTAELKRAEAFTLIDAAALAKERPRKCGTRKERGVYAVAPADADSAAAAAALKELVESGVVEAGSTEIVGSFVRFMEPIRINEKRFRGLKQFRLTPAVEDASTDALDAL